MNGNNAAAIPYDSTCEWCRWFRREFGHGYCYVAPPALMVDAKGNVHTERPVVDADDVCALWLPSKA